MLRPISWYARLSTFLAYFPFLFSFLVVAAVSAEDNICVPPPGALPLPGTLPSGTSAKRCCQDERPSGVCIWQLLAWCLVRLKGTRNCIYWEMASRFSRILHVWSDNGYTPISAGGLQTICGQFLRDGGARILRSISTPAGMTSIPVYLTVTCLCLFAWKVQVREYFRELSSRRATSSSSLWPTLRL